MSATRKRNADAGTSADSQSSQASTAKPTRKQPSPQAFADRPFAVIVRGGRRTLWGHYPDRAEAESTAGKLRSAGFDAVANRRLPP